MTYAVVASGRFGSDQSVVCAAVAAVVASVVDRRAAAIAVVAQLFLAATQLLGNDAVRLLSAGLVFAAVVASLVVLNGDRGMRLPLRAGIAVAAIVATALYVLPFAVDGVAYAIYAAIAATLLLLLARKPAGDVSLAAVTIAVIVVSVTPPEPPRALLYPIVIAAAGFAARRRSIAGAMTAIIVAVVAGKWAIPLAALMLIGLYERKSEGDRSVVMPPLMAAPLARMLPLAPFFTRAAFGATHRAVAAALLLVIAGAITGRPQLLTIYIVTALFLLVLVTRHDDDVTVAMLTGSSLVFFAWSGALARTFPLPVSALAAAALVIMLSAAVMRRLTPPVSAAVAAAALLFITTIPRHPLSDGRSETALRAGASAGVPLAAESASAHVLLSATNFTAIAPERVVAHVEWVERDGRGYRQEVRAAQLADWGAFRRSASFRSLNALPPLPAGMFNGVGRDSWMRGTGAIRIRGAKPIELVRVRAAHDLPAAATLILEKVAATE